LRPAWPEDWEAVLSGVADEGVVMNLARVPWPYGAAEARQFVAQRQDPCLPHFLVVESASGQVVGSAGLGEHRGEVEIGYWLARPWWGRGYATEAARGVLSVARTLGHRHLVAGHFIDNPASGAVLRKLGFTPREQRAHRYCLARGCDVISIEYNLDPCDELAEPQMRAA
jgi:RimJ/RimL family protein N-acetyltransferase